MAHTDPAVNIPSKKNVKLPVSKYALVSPPNANDKKNPTHVGIHNIHVINSPQKVEWLIIHVRGLLNIDP